MCFVDQGSEEYIRHTVRKLGEHHQSSHNSGVQSHCIRQINQYKAGEQAINHIGCQVTGTVTYLVVPF